MNCCKTEDMVQPAGDTGAGNAAGKKAARSNPAVNAPASSTEGAAPPTGRFTAQHVKQEIDLSQTDDETGTDETGRQRDGDDDEGFSPSDSEKKGKKRAGQQPKEEYKKKKTRTREPLGDGEGSNIVSGGLPSVRSAVEEGNLPAPSLNPGIGAPPISVTNRHLNVRTGNQHFALKHLMTALGRHLGGRPTSTSTVAASGTASQGTPTSTDGARGGGCNGRFGQLQGQERRVSTRDVEKGQGVGIPSGDTGARGLNPGIGAPPISVTNRHLNVRTGNQHFALKHLMTALGRHLGGRPTSTSTVAASGTASQGTPTSTDGARGGGCNGRFGQLQGQERRVSTRDVEKGQGVGIPSGDTGARGESVGSKVGQSYRWTPTKFPSAIPVSGTGAEDWMRPVGFGEVADSCKTNPTHLTGHASHDAWVRGFGFVDVANSNYDNMAAHPREAVGVPSVRTSYPYVTSSPHEFLHAMPSDEDISSLIDQHSEWSSCSSESDRFHDAGVDDFDDI